MPDSFPGACSALAGRTPQVVEEWLARYDRSRIRIPGKVERRALAAPARGIAATLAQALSEPGCGPGTPALRETEKLLTFAGGTLAMSAATAFDVVALVVALRDVLLAEASGADERAALGALFDWLGALAVEGFCSSREDTLRVRTRDSLERGTPVIMITRELPAALLVGDPDRGVLESVFGRLLLAIVRSGARAIVVDGSGLMAATGAHVLEALRDFAVHRKVKTLLTILSGLPAAETEKAWTAVFPDPTRVVCTERFDDAVARALRA